MNKSAQQMQRELQKHKVNEAALRLKKHSRESKLQHQIGVLHRRETNEHDVDCEILREIATGMRKLRYADWLLDALLYLEQNTRLLREVEHVRGAITMLQRRSQWIRPVHGWKPKSHNASRQFSSLARHLFARYDVPKFMDSVWYQDKVRPQKWFLHLGAGQNIRTAKGLPVALTRKMAHCFMQAPADCDVSSAIRWAQVHALGGDARLAQAIIESRLGRRFRDNEFWLSVMQFFVIHSSLDRAEVLFIESSVTSTTINMATISTAHQEPQVV